MKGKNGFTLIELLSVIVIIGVIAFIVSPMLIKTIRRSEKQAFEQSIDGILNTIRLDYSNDNFFAPREYYYEKKNLILLTVNDKTRDEKVEIKGEIDGKGFVYVDRDGIIHVENICNTKYCADGIESEINITENESGVVPEISKEDPMIRLNGEETVYVHLNDHYEELGAVAKTKSGKKLSYNTEIVQNGEIVTDIDTSKPSTYLITYKTESVEKEVSVTRTVIVLDMRPAITVTEGKESYVKEQEVLVTVSAIKPNKVVSFIVEVTKDGLVMNRETVIGHSQVIKLSETGEYEVKVIVTDDNGHTTITISSYKIDAEPPEITFTEEIELNANEVAGFNLTEDETVVVSDNSGEEVTLQVKGELNTTVGEKYITYIAIDQAGNKTEKIRTILIKPAIGPVVFLESMSTNDIWIQPRRIMIGTRIEIENDEITELTYQVDNNAVVNVAINDNKSMDVEVDLNTTGKHKIKVIAVGKHGNKTEVQSGEYLIDADKPTIGTIEGNTDTWSAYKTISANLTDPDSKVKYYAFKNNATQPEENSSEWKVIDSPESSYNFSQKVTLNGTYYLWAKDSAGNISEVKSVVVNKIDEKVPELTVNNYSGKYNDNKALSALYAAKFGDMGGSVTCKNGNTTIINVSNIKLAGTYSIKCTALGNNGKSTEKTITLTLASRTFTEIMSGTGRFNETAKSFEEIMNVASDVKKDPYGNSRYVGSNPNNYVSFNNEKWRVIGLFDGKVKLMRKDVLVKRAKDSTGLVDWSKTELSKYLNDTYLPTIEATSKAYIDTTYEWKLGAHSSVNGTRSVFYNAERGTNVPSGFATTWTGAVGLLYPSDYGYSTSSTSPYCNDVGLYDWNTTGNAAVCRTNSWIKNQTYWTITPTTGGYSFIVYNASGYGLGNDSSTWAHGVYPVVFLKSNIKVKSGKGTEADPYILTESSVNNNDPGKNLRYVGKNPNNYVRFNNNELWRIIGLFENYPKIIRSSSIGNKNWNTSNTNNWVSASLNTELNDTYLKNTIDSTSQAYIDSQHKWKLGGWSTSVITRSQAYNYERQKVYPGNDLDWTGSIALMYASDYAYASSGGSACDRTSLWNWDNETKKDGCVNNDWLYSSVNHQWTLTHRTLNANMVFSIVSTAFVNGEYSLSPGDVYDIHSPNVSNAVSPTLYLKTTVKIKGGTGTSGDPYILGI